MNSFKEGSKEAFLYSIMNEEHKKPNIIRGNSSKLRAGSSCVKSNHGKSTTPSVSAALKSLDVENISCTSNNNMTIENVIIAETTEDSVPVANAVDSLTLNGSTNDYICKVEESQECDNDTQQQVFDVSDPGVSYFVNEFGEIQVFSSNNGEDIKIKESPDDNLVNNEPVAPEEGELIQASLQTEEGEYIILVKNGEIVAVQPPGAKEPREIDRSSASQEWSVVPHNDTDKSILSNPEENLDASQSTVSIYQPSGVSVDSTVLNNPVAPVQVQEQEFVSTPSQSDVDPNQYFVTVQLADGQNILLPISALENTGSGQIVFNGNDQMFEVISSSNNSFSKNTGTSQSKPKANKAKKRPATARSSAPSNSSVKSSSTKNVVSSVTTSSGFLAPSHQMNAIADAIVNQRNVDSNLRNQPMPPAPIYPSYSRTNFTRIEASPQKELKPKPFRFEISESDDENMEYQSSTFLPLVIENYQSSFRKQMITNQSSNECNSDPSKTDGIAIKLPLDHSVGAYKIVGSKTSEQFQSKVPMSPATTQCSKCSFKASGRCSLSEHMTSSHSEELPYKCLKCHRKFLYHYLLLNHLKLHSNAEHLKPPISCDHCKVEFKTSTELDGHTCSESVENGLRISPSRTGNDTNSNASIRPKQYPCMENSCYDWFDNEIKAVRHKLEKHWSEFVQVPYQCQFCCSSFESKTEALKHLRIHEEEKVVDTNVQDKVMKNYTDIHSPSAHIKPKETNNATVIIPPKAQLKPIEALAQKFCEIHKNVSNSSPASGPTLQELRAKVAENSKIPETNNSSTTIQATEVSKEFMNLFAKIRDEANEKARQKTKPRDEQPSSSNMSLGCSITNATKAKSLVTKTSMKSTPAEDSVTANSANSELEITKQEAGNKEPELDSKDSNLTLNKNTTIRRHSRKVNPSLKAQRPEEDKLLVVSDDEIELIYKPVKQQMLEITETSSIGSTEPNVSTTVLSNFNPKRVTRSQLSKNDKSSISMSKRNAVAERDKSASVKRRC